MNYEEKTSCRVCGSSNLKQVIDLRDQPLANSYHNTDEILNEYPLILNLCEECYHTQLSVVVEPSEMFKHYLYVSGTTTTLRDYFKYFYDITSKYINKGKRVLDIACNDGSQLEVFKEKGWGTYGIDPAENLYELSSKKGFTKIVCAYLNEDSVSKLNEKMDVIIAQNVFAHIDDIHDFLRCCKLISHEDTEIFIQTSQANMFVNNEFDTIYHEHLSFFCANSMNACVRKNDLFLEDIIKTDIHGTSYVFVISNKKVEQTKIEKVLKEESKEGKTTLRFYETFASKALKVINDLKEAIEVYRKDGYAIVGYGAAAKGMTLLNFGKIKLDFIIDDNPLKHDLLTPGTDIIIKGPEHLRSDKKMVIIPLAWNFYKEIKERVRKERQNPKDVFIKYFPELQINE